MSEHLLGGGELTPDVDMDRCVYIHTPDIITCIILCIHLMSNRIIGDIGCHVDNNYVLWSIGLCG